MNDQRSNYGRRHCKGGREEPEKSYFLPFELEEMNHDGHRETFICLILRKEVIY